MKVLAIGENAKEFAQDIFPEANVDWSDLKLHKKGEYDAVLSYMSLNRVPYREVGQTLKSWLSVLKQGGEFALMVPSLEWAAVQILSSECSPVVLIHLFGQQGTVNQNYHSGFTMLNLRMLLSQSGVAVTHASTGEYMIGENVCEMHTVRGIKK